MHFLTSPKNILPLFFLSIVACRLAAQQSDIRFDHISLEQGLSQSTVNAIVQDSLGFLWFATQDGLNRYDGYSITVLKHNPSDTNTISDNSIWCLLSDRRGDLWIGTARGGVDRYLLRENRLIHYVHRENDPTSISENDVISLFEDSNGDVWLGTLNNGLNRFNHATQTFDHFTFQDGTHSGLANNTVWAICEDRQKNLWVGTWRGLSRLKLRGTTLSGDHERFETFRHSSNDRASLSGDNIRSLCVDRRGTLWVGAWGSGLNRYDAATNRFTRFVHNAKDPWSISSNLILSLIEDSKGNLWIGTEDGGMNVLNRAGNGFTRFKSDPAKKDYLNSDIVSAFCEDRSGILWIGTGAGGVNVYDWRKNRFKHYADDLNNPNDMSGNDVWAILEDRDGELWIGTVGNGLNRFDKTRSHVRQYKHHTADKSTLSHNSILSLLETTDGSIWIGTQGGGLDRFNKVTQQFEHFKHRPKDANSLSLDEITTLCEDRNANLWIGTNGGIIDVLHLSSGKMRHYIPDEKNPQGLAGTSVTAIHESRDGTIWIGSLGGGLQRLIRAADSFQHFQPSREVNSGPNNNTILSIHEDASGILWLGTYGGGVNRFDPATERFSYYTEQNGLPNNVVYGILPDKRNNLWLSTNKGISRFDPGQGTFRNYDLTDGLQGNEFNQGSHFASKRGELFFGGLNGLNAFFPEAIRDNDYVPPVYLTNFKVFDTPIPGPIVRTGVDRIQLSYAENFFSFELVALNFTSPEKNRYMYMLEGLDKDWIAVSSLRRYASYTNLDPGEYVLRIKGSNNDGVWNEQGTAIGIVIIPPYWKTLWFQVLVVLAAAAILFLMYRYRVNKLLEIERIRSSIAVDLHDDIGSTLTEIALYSDVGLREVRARVAERSLDGKLNKVESLLEDIGSTSRGLIDAMNDIVWAVDPKNDSFEFLLLRMKNHAARMFDAKGINYEIDIPEAISHLHLPLGFRRRFYLIFKEAVNNIIRHAHSTKVQLTISKEGRSLIMTIIDDGKGFDVKSEPQGNGLNNMQKRAQSLNGTLSIESALKQGTTVKLRASIP